MKKRFYFRTKDFYGMLETDEVVFRVLADDFGDAMNFITRTVAKENAKGIRMRVSDWVFLREEPEDRSWMDFTGFDTTY